MNSIKEQNEVRPLVVLEPLLQIQVITYDANQRRRLGHVYLRWARQLFVSARVIEKASGLPVRRRKPFLPRA